MGLRRWTSCGRFLSVGGSPTCLAAHRAGRGSVARAERAGCPRAHRDEGKSPTDAEHFRYLLNGQDGRQIVIEGESPLRSELKSLIALVLRDSFARAAGLPETASSKNLT